MKKIIFALIAMVSLPVAADYYKVNTNNCDPVAMRATLERAAREHRAVITEVNCEYTRAEPVVVATPAPIYAAPAMMDYSNIPVVPCAPHPTRNEYCGGCY